MFAAKAIMGFAVPIIIQAVTQLIQNGGIDTKSGWVQAGVTAVLSGLGVYQVTNKKA